MSLLALTVIRSADTQGRIAANDLENARVEALAEAGVNIAMLHLLEFRHAAHPQIGTMRMDGEPVFCRLPGAIAALDVEDEGGKIDLNAASSDLIAALIEATGADKNEAREIAGNIIAFRSNGPGLDLNRSAESSADLDLPPFKHALFDAAFEVEQVPGMRSDLFRAIRPYLTVMSHTSGVDPDTASAALISMLSRARSASPSDAIYASRSKSLSGAELPQEFSAPSNSNAFVVRAEVHGAHHAVFVREALIEFPPNNPQHALVREWRRGQRRFTSRPEIKSDTAVLPPC